MLGIINEPQRQSSSDGDATRPDFPRGYLGLARALRLLGSAPDAREALLQAEGGSDLCQVVPLLSK